VLKKDTIKVSLKLASNQFTQNTYLHSLFHWKQVPAAKLLDSLGKMTFAPQEEILKFLKEIFDACFAVLDAKVPNATPQVYDSNINSDFDYIENFELFTLLFLSTLINFPYLALLHWSL